MNVYESALTGSQVDTAITTVTGSNLSATHKITRTATLVIAASDSSAKAKAQADYVCDGTLDNVEIQTAVDALPATGGEIKFLSGSYQLGATITRAIDSITFTGTGFNCYIKYNAGTACFSVGSQKYWSFQSLRVDYGGITLSGGTKWSLVNCWRESVSGSNPPTYIDNWSETNFAHRIKKPLLGTMRNHPLMQTITTFDAQDWTGSGTGAAWTYDSTTTWEGAYSAKVVTGSGSVAYLTKTATFQDLTNCAFGIVIRSPDITKLSNITIDIGSDGASLQHYATVAISTLHTINDEWFILKAGTLGVAAGSPNYTAINYIRLRVTPASSQVATIYIGGLLTWKKALTPRGAVTFVFDDALTSCLSIAKPYMEKYGYRGVSAVPLTEMSAAKITNAKTLHRSGWDVIGHGLHHISCATAPDWEMMLPQRWLFDNGFEGEFLALPAGTHDAAVKRYADDYFSLTRTAMAGYNSLPYPGSMHSCATVTSSSTIGSMQGWVTQASTNKLWTVISIGDIVAANPTSTQMLQSNFNSLIDFCNSSNVEVLTYSDIVKRIQDSVISNSGTGTLANGTTSVNIRHGFHKVPTTIEITPTTSLGSAASIWISTKDVGSRGNEFTVSVNTDPGADVTFEWRAVL